MNLNLTIALAGNPNSGKSTLFNALTGLNQKTGNFPGTTVDRKSGELVLENSAVATLIDLPGTYSLYPKSGDERVTVEMLASTPTPDVVILVADASNLKRSLLLCTEVIDLGLPVVLALNMLDLAAKKSLHIQSSNLAAALGIEVVEVNARKRIGIDVLKKAIAETKKAPKPFYQINPAIVEFLNELYPSDTEAPIYKKLIAAHHLAIHPAKNEQQQQILEKYQFNSDSLQQRETVERFKNIDNLLIDCLSRTKHELRDGRSTLADRILTHKYWGFLIFFVILFIVFQSIFNLSTYPMDFIETSFNSMGNWVHEQLPNSWWNDLLVDGVIAGLSGVISFLPQIMILFAFITILEDSGYMARVSFIMDRMMRRFGLNGKSVVPLIGGMACAVPSIMSTRSIENSRDRLITILVTPLMSCSARLPVYTLLIGLVTPEKYIFGFIGIQGLLLFLMYLVGFFSAIFVAWIFKFIIKQGTGNFFVMELPVYKLPALRNLWLNVYDRSKTFVREAGLIIVGVSVVLWFAGSFGPGNSFAQIEKNYADKMLTQQIPKADLDIQMKTEKLEASYAGHFGHLIEPLIKPLGFDWKIGIALISSFAAREVFVGTMSTIYSIGDEENTKGIRERMRAEKDPATGLPKYTPVLALSLMFFYAFALQCTSTIAVVRRETKGWKWPIIQLVFMTLMAWTSSFVIYQVFH